MRKKTIKYGLDKILWLFLMLLPLLVYAIQAHQFGIEGVTIYDVFYGGLGFDMTDGIIVDAVYSFIGPNGYVPLIDSMNIIPFYIQWLCVVVIVQLVYDFLMFIPKLAHKFMHKFTQDEE